MAILLVPRSLPPNHLPSMHRVILSMKTRDLTGSLPEWLPVVSTQKSFVWIQARGAGREEVGLTPLNKLYTGAPNGKF